MMVVSQVHSIDQSKERDGCLLLWFAGNVLFSLNESALVVWAEMERNPEEVSSEQLVEYLDEYYSGCHVSKVRLRQDVRELIGCLLERGFVRVLEGKGDSAKFKIKEFARVRQVCAGVERARIWYPKKVQCLQRSAVLSCLLRREGVPARMVI